jgi:hypothetical protein
MRVFEDASRLATDRGVPMVTSKALRWTDPGSPGLSE